MTHTLTIIAGDLQAADEPRTVTGLLLPFGEIGSTNLGKLTAQPNTVTIPGDISILNLNADHKGSRPRGRFLSAAETADGIVASFRIGELPEGDAILAAIAAGQPPALSVELADVEINDAQQIIAGQLTGAAVVDKPAYPSARLVAEHTDPDPTTTDPDPDPTPEGSQMPEATTVPLGGAPAVTPTPPASTFADFLAAMSAGDLHAPAAAAARDLFAALADNKYDGENAVGTATRQPQWLGEMWSPIADVRRVIPLFKSAALESLEWVGYRWTDKPTVDKWSGNKSAIPSKGGKTEKVTGSAQRFAGGFDTAIEFTHFGQTALVEQLVRFLIESYAIKSDAYVLDQVLAAASPLDPGAAPTDVPPALGWIVDGALQLLGDNVQPTFALVSPTDWRDVLLAPKDHRLEFLSTSLGLESGEHAGFTIKPHASITTGTALVGSREAVTVRELPGAPVRVSALDIARGGVDDAVFGYIGVQHDYPDALQLVGGTTEVTP